MRSRAAVVLVLAAAMTGGACLLKRSPVSRTFVLDPIEEARSAEGRPVTAGAVAGVAKVSVPDWLDRPFLVVHAAGGEIVPDEFSRWGEPLTRGIQRVLTENLAALLPDRRVVAAPFEPRQTVNHRVEVTILDATRRTDGSVLVEARWDVVGARGEALARRRFSRQVTPTAPGAPGLVAGVNEALAALSREIADALRALPPVKEEQPALR